MDTLPSDEERAILRRMGVILRTKQLLRRTR
jgi:hypothetical protein